MPNVPKPKSSRPDLVRLKPLQAVQLLNSTPLGEVLNTRRLREWRAAAGHRIGDGNSINLLKLVAWLAHRHHFERPSESEQGERILRTVPDVSAYYGVTPTLVRCQWLVDPDFPGRVGESGKGKRNGYFPLDSINRWLLRRESQRKTGPVSKAAKKAAEDLGVSGFGESTTRDQILELVLEEKRMNLKARREQLIERDLVLKTAIHLAEVGKQCFSRLPENILSNLPVQFEPKITAEIRRVLERQVKRIIDAFDEFPKQEFLQDRQALNRIDVPFG